MQSQDKLFFIRAYIDEFREKVLRLDDLSKKFFKDEALILCAVYIDWLASGRYSNGKESSKENFCRALRELSGNDFFSAIHPKVLLNGAGKRGIEAQTILDRYIQAHPGRFFTRGEMDHALRVSALPDAAKTSLIANLWRASVAAICYDRIRCQVVHGPGRSVDLSFGKFAYNGKTAMAINFDLLYRALKAIFCEVESASLQTGEWFGNPDYK